MNSQPYYDIMRPLFEQSFLSAEKKLCKCQNYLNQLKPDVLFIQEASQDLITMLKAHPDYDLQVGPKSDALILARKGRLGQRIDTEKVLSLEEGVALNWQDRTAVMVVGTFILLSGHLSSDKKKNALNV